MKIDPKKFQVTDGGQFKLRKYSTLVKPFYQSKEHYKELLEADVEKLSELQPVLYASNKYSLLLIFQAMDAAGKDGAISHVLSGINPQGCEVHSFKQPSTTELDHDFLWRTNQCLPERGRIGVFNRSYYEEVLVVKVHPEYLEGQGLDPKMGKEKDFWTERYKSIADLERHLYRNGTRVLKFFLHVSKEEQRKRLLDRIDQPEKNWKFSETDVAERKFWDTYMSAYEDCIRATGTGKAPWFVVPADDKRNARLIISGIVIDALKKLPMDYPEVTAERRDELQSIRRQLEK